MITYEQAMTVMRGQRIWVRMTGFGGRIRKVKVLDVYVYKRKPAIKVRWFGGSLTVWQGHPFPFVYMGNPNKQPPITYLWVKERK